MRRSFTVGGGDGWSASEWRNPGDVVVRIMDDRCNRGVTSGATIRNPNITGCTLTTLDPEPRHHSLIQPPTASGAQ